jgi:FkbM family methyltransferase
LPALRADVRRRTAAALAALRRGELPRPARATAPGGPTAAALEAAMRRDAEDVANIRRLLAFSLPPEANCIDVGAHRGAVLGEMVRVAPQGRHIAFEPLPHLCEVIRTSFPSVELHQAALSNHPGEADFAYVHGHAEGWSGLRFRPLPTGEEAEVEHITVKLEVLDQVLDPDYRPHVIKIDVEGAEQQVFEGALETLRRHRPIVIFEHGTGSAETFGTGPGDIYQLLREQAGLRIYDLDGSGPYTAAEFERVFYAAERVNFVARP